jgi:murein DD-endopeptidase MepM/ murein hydrolase activator NlpD
VHDNISFTWPADGTMRVTSLPSGGCNIKFVIVDRGVVRSIGRGRVVKVHNIPTKRIAQQYEIVVRHDGGFESSYGIVDQTPNLPAGGVGPPMLPGTLVEDGGKLYEVRNGGVLHFQLFYAGKLVDPRKYIRTECDDGTDASHGSQDA